MSEHALRGRAGGRGVSDPDFTGRYCGTMAALLARVRTLVWLVLPTFLSGCLGAAYRVPVDEMARIVQLPPEQRGADVLVTQLDQGAENIEATPIVTTSTHTQVRVDVDVDDDNSSSSSSDGDVDASAALVIGVVLAVTAVGVLAALSAIESERYIGRVAIDPSTPVYLRRVDGSWLRGPIAGVGPEHLVDVDEARLILEEDSFERLGRSPLDRTGFAYGLDLGAASVSNARDLSNDPWPWLQARMGGYPIQELGIYGAVGFVFASDDGALVNFRYAAEVDVMPLQVELFSLGFYAHAGLNHRLHDVGGVTREALGGFYGGGIAVEIEVTTTLSVSLRGGCSALHEGANIVPLGEVGLGANVY
jgi:hypothetical protein